MNVLLLDMDGTLVDSMGKWSQVEIDYFTDNGVSPDMIDFEVLTTAGLVPVLKVLDEQYGFTLSLEDAREYMHARMEDFYAHDVTLLPGVQEALDAFQALGVRMAVGTATSLTLATKSLAHTQIDQYMEFLYSTSCDRYNKNDKRFYQATADLFGVPKANQVFVDDSIYALVAGKESGLYTVGYVDPARPDCEHRIEEVGRVSDEVLVGFEDFDAESWCRAHDLLP